MVQLSFKGLSAFCIFTFLLFLLKFIIISSIHQIRFSFPWNSIAIKHKETVGNIFQWKTLVMWGKNWHWLFFFLGGFHRLSIHIKIKVHFCSFAFGNERTLVSCSANLWEALRLFYNANENVNERTLDSCSENLWGMLRVFSKATKMWTLILKWIVSILLKG